VEVPATTCYSKIIRRGWKPETRNQKPPWYSFYCNAGLNKKTTGIMKKFIAMSLVALSLAACNDESKSSTTSDTAVTTTANPDTTSATTTTTTTTSNSSYTASEGDVSYRNKKLMVYRNGEWVESKEDAHLDNGLVIYRNGRATRDGKEIHLEDSVVVDHSGKFFDRTGNAIDNAWDKTKEGVKDAGKAVGNAAEKLGKSVKNAVDKDGKKDEKKNN
jgi:hypothetical protein